MDSVTFDERIRIYRLDGKRGYLLHRYHYDQVKDFILSKLREKKEVTLPELLAQSDQLQASMNFKGEIIKCILDVKADLQARGFIRVKIDQDFTQHILPLKPSRW